MVRTYHSRYAWASAGQYGYKTSKVLVVCAVRGYVFGGGCEIQLHGDAILAAAAKLDFLAIIQ